MPAITIENLPSLVYEQLMQAAALHQRHLTQEMVTRLEQSFSSPTAGSRLPRHQDASAEARASRTLRNGHLVMTAELDLAKTEG